MYQRPHYPEANPQREAARCTLDRWAEKKERSPSHGCCCCCCSCCCCYSYCCCSYRSKKTRRAITDVVNPVRRWYGATIHSQGRTMSKARFLGHRVLAYVPSSSGLDLALHSRSPARAFERLERFERPRAEDSPSFSNFHRTHHQHPVSACLGLALGKSQRGRTLA